MCAAAQGWEKSGRVGGCLGGGEHESVRGAGHQVCGWGGGPRAHAHGTPARQRRCPTPVGAGRGGLPGCDGCIHPPSLEFKALPGMTLASPPRLLPLPPSP